MPGPVFLEGDRLTLRPVRPEEYTFVARHYTNPWMRHGAFEDVHTPVSEEQVGTRIEEEGVLREHWRGFGRYVDEYRYGLLESDR